jgi:hypothetical protein
MEKINKRIEELDDEGWTSDLAFFCGCDWPLEYS